jgi:hypothetical protein
LFTVLYLIANVAATKMGGAACPKDPHRPPVFPQLSSMKPSRPSDRYAPTASRHAANLICERLISRDLSPDRGHFSIGETQPNRKNGKLMRLIALRSRPVTNSYKLQSLIRGYLYKCGSFSAHRSRIGLFTSTFDSRMDSKARRINTSQGAATFMAAT